MTSGTITDTTYTTTHLPSQLADVAHSCTACGLCVRECGFLQNHGTPKQIATTCSLQPEATLPHAFACHLCGLCTAVCPHPVDPKALFLAMRQEAFDRGIAQFSEHSPLRRYENSGTSKRFTWYGLPEQCDTVFFPGCSLSGSRSQTVRDTFFYLQQHIPALGIVLDCCTKPSHDLGDHDHFNSMFSALKDALSHHGIKRVLTACPNCYEVFSRYAPELTVTSVYSVLNQLPLPDTPKLTDYVTVHDPCVARFDTDNQTAVRELLWKKGLTIREMPHSQKRTLCCGQGAGVSLLFPDSSRRWTAKRCGEAEANHIVNYCASCTQAFAPHAESSHILDLLFRPEQTLAGRVKVAKAPLTYLNRLSLKRHLQRTLPVAVSQERAPADKRRPATALGLKLLVLMALAAALFVVHNSALSGWLEQERLRAMIAGYGLLAPLVYMLIYSLAPALLLPGLPLGIIGGILFGPFWGVVYTITSATVGACIAFLISRYLARDLIRQKLKHPRWHQLDRQVADNGWKIVALTRLVPLFPFNLLNYAFGLTPVRFVDYAVATFIFMLPGTIAFITFSSSLLDLLHGRLSSELLIGIALLGLMALLPVLYRRHKNRAQQGAH